MSTSYQLINRVVQWAVSDSKSFSEEINEDTTEEELEEAAEEAAEFRDLMDNYFKELYIVVYQACLDTYMARADLED
jgi:hypothetical protein